MPRNGSFGTDRMDFYIKKQDQQVEEKIRVTD